MTNKDLFIDYKLTDNEFNSLKNLIYKNSGINLTSGKKELVKARLTKRLRHFGFKSFKEYYNFVLNEDKVGKEMVILINSISTNKTDFFRENQHFEFIKKTILPTLLEVKRKKGIRRLRVWSAACSTGEEPYSIGITFLEELGFTLGWDLKILGVDISTEVLNEAISGKYRKEKLKSVPLSLKDKYFKKLTNEYNGYYEVNGLLKQIVVFRRMDMINEPFPFKGLFDIIFCRNVMIYFDKKTQTKLITKFHKFLEPNGYLFIGHSESLHDIQTGYKYVAPTIYQKK